MDITDITSFKVKCPSPPGIFQTWPLDLCPGVGWRSLSSANWMRFIQQFRTDRGGNGITVRDATEATQVKQRVLKVVRICRDWSYYWSLKYHRLYTVEKVIYIYVYPYTHSLNIQHINTPIYIYIHQWMNRSRIDMFCMKSSIHPGELHQWTSEMEGGVWLRRSYEASRNRGMEGFGLDDAERCSSFNGLIYLVPW